MSETPTALAPARVLDAALRGAPAPRARPVSARIPARMAWGLFALLFVVYNLNFDFLPGNDAKPSAYLPVALFRDGSLSFTPAEFPFMFHWRIPGPQRAAPVAIDRWTDRIDGRQAGELLASGDLELAGEKYYLVPSRQAGRYVSIYAPGAGLAAVPVLALMSLLPGALQDSPRAIWYGAKITASGFAPGSAVLVFLTAALFTSRRRALLVFAIYGLGTSVWSVSSQTLWQHAPNEFFLALGTYFLAAPSRRPGPRHGLCCGLAFACAVACRPPSGIVLLAVGVYLCIARRRSVPAYALGCLLPLLALAAYNTWQLGSPLSFGQAARGVEVAREKTGVADAWQTPLLQGAAGVLFSPSRGLLVYSPVLIFAFWGLFLVWRSRTFAVFRPLGLAVLGQLLLVCKWFDWWGGWSFGYRLVVDATPTLALLVVPVLDRVSRRGALRAALAALLVWSVLVQALGACAYNMLGWNARLAYAVRPPGREREFIVDDRKTALELARDPATRVALRRLDIDRREYRQRLWSIADSQILYYLSHLGEARKTRRDMIRDWLEHPSR